MDSDAVPDAPGQRMLAAIVFTDAVGFSARVGKDEEGTLMLIKRDLDTMASMCKRFEGQVIKSSGDGLMMMFTSAVQAVSCALEIQKTLTEIAKGTKDALTHRIGIHLGDVLVSNGDALGDGVNVAARLEQEAEPGGICLSQTVYDVVKNRLFLEAARIGDLKLKNIAEPVVAYKISGVGKAKKHQKAYTPNWAVVTAVILLLVGAAAGATALIMSRSTPSAEAAPNLPRGSDKMQAGLDALKKISDSKVLDRLMKSGADMATEAQKSAAQELKKNPELSTTGSAGAPKTPDPTKSPVSKGETDPPPTTISPSSNPVTYPAPPTAPSPNDTSPASRSPQSPAFQAAWKQYVRHFDFNGMAQWVLSNPGEVPAGEKAEDLIARFKDNATFIDWFTSQLSTTSQEKPLTFQWGNNKATAWQRDDGRTVLTFPRGTFLRRLPGFFPHEILQIARALILQLDAPAVTKAEIRAHIKLYIKEFADHAPDEDAVGMRPVGNHPGG